MADVFISYKQEEREAVEQIASQLLGLGLSVWFDSSLTAGESFSDEIDREVRLASVVLVCWSPAARHSRWVKAEAMIGFDHDKLAACRVAGPDEFSPPAPFNTVHTEDLRAWLASPTSTHAGWKSVLRRIGRLCMRGDIESWAGFGVPPTLADMRAWTRAYETSPLFAIVSTQLRAREELEAERLRSAEQERQRLDREAARRRERDAERAKQVAHDLRVREEAARREREQALRAAEAAEQARLDTERRQQEEENARLAEMRRQWRRRTGPLLLAVTCGAVSAIGWNVLQSIPTPEERVEAARLAAQRRVDETRLAAERRAEHLAFTDAQLRNEAREMRMGSGETLSDLLVRAGASSVDAAAVFAAISSVYNPSRLRPGQPISCYFRRDSGGPRLVGISFRSDPGASVTANRTTSGSFEAREVLMPVTFEIARIAAPVQTSLYGTALNLGATDREVAALADAFSYDLDFQRNVRSGDEFELVFERYYDDQGNTVRTGDLLFVGLESDRGLREYYQFLAPGDSRPDWYDSNGMSARRLLMRTPITGAEPSSRYSHTHRGIEYAAAVDTLVLASGDGTVVQAGPVNSRGNYLRIRHTDGYETGYAHLSRFEGGIRRGEHVRQGQAIGYLGDTGRVDGPHLFYEVLLRGSPIDPTNSSVPSARRLTGRALELFIVERERIDRLRQDRASEASGR